MATLRRLPQYRDFLRKLSNEGHENVSSAKIAESLSISAILVRKDLATVCSDPGQPRIGFKIQNILNSIENFLGYNNTEDVILVGVGQLGRAFLAYDGYIEYGMNIIAAFDQDPVLEGISINDKPVFPMEKLESMIQRLHIRLGIITVPASQAQAVCDLMVKAGIRGILNFAHIHLEVPNGVVVKNNNIAVDMALVMKKLHR